MSNPWKLSPREKEILDLLGQNQNKEIARKLGISKQTVANHLIQIYRKMQVRDRLQAVIKAMRYYLVDHRAET